jgi:serine/threonine protein kinase
MINKNHVPGIEEEVWKKHRQYFINRLQDEVRIWKELKHQNIVKFISIVESANTVYIFL